MKNFRFSSEPRQLMIYHYTPEGLLHSWGEEIIPPHSGLPAYSTLVAPPERRTNVAIVYDRVKHQWDEVPDYRGHWYYHKETGEPEEIESLGPIPEHLTVLKPPSPFHNWQGDEWVLDEEAKATSNRAANKSQKMELLKISSTVIQSLHVHKEMTHPESVDLLVEIDRHYEAWSQFNRAVLQVLHESDELITDWPAQPELPSF